MLALSGTAHAATIHTPDDGATVQQGANVYFDWAWDDDEYATAWIGFARSIDGPWTPRPELTVQDCSYGVCGPWLESHATILAPAAGVWYWRLCNKSIYGEDDKCSYDAGVAPRLLTVLPAPACSDGIDNDGDGVWDYPRDPGCSSADDTDETDPVQPDPDRLIRCSGTAWDGFFRQLTQRHTTCSSARRVMRLWVKHVWAGQATKRSAAVLVYRCRLVILQGADNPYGRVTCRSAGGKYVRFYGA